MATAEPTRADGADPDKEPDAGARIVLPAQRDSEKDGRSRSRPAWLEWLCARPILYVTLVAGVLHLVWFFVFANSGGDLAAQDAWAEFVGRHPDSAYNLAWYGGMHPVSYSVVSPYLMSVFGVRTTMMVAGTLSATLLTLVLVRSRVVSRVLPPAFLGVFGLVCNAISGRVTYGLGTLFALAAVAVVFCWPHRWRRRRWAKALLAAPLAGIATAASPVAGLFVGLVAVALFLQKRRPGAWALGIAPTVVVGLSAWLFPFSGTQPMDVIAAGPPLLCSLIVAWGVPKDWKTVRVTAWVYALAVLLTWVISSQIGSNVTRLGMVFGGAVLLAALPFIEPRTRRWYIVGFGVFGFVVWIAIKTIIDIIHTTPAASWARELAPLVHHLEEEGADKGRVEVVPTRSHREASALAPYVNLARGWNRQADMERNPLFYDDTLNSANYHEWLQRWAVHFIVLPKDSLDGTSGPRERELILRGQPYLKLLWGDKNWQLYEVTDPAPLAEPPASVTRADQGELTVEVERAGRVLIRIPYSPWLGLVNENGKSLKAPQETPASKNRADGEPKEYRNTNGCLMEAEEDAAGDKWTELLAPGPGVYRLAAPYQLPRGTPCPEELR
ncbi:integral membrane protein [Streptomyces albus]|uniref:Integral membrane protein n=1 Tax=Streptomyces albus (strain ATCC 21838 / DSM 41398 / FERM P-419 / JCM 4703 / NBRC 107858) TaxID=1081613 RepID=A0A0B5EPM1_STRA4|nr:integral membrane protein [Streptomyces albus]AOU79024.1 integral membrane protein [Streptomyces albus]